MNIFYKLKTLFKRKPYTIKPVNSDITDVVITHITGVEIRIESSGTVIISSPTNLELRSNGNLHIESKTHIGLVAPRIDLN